MADEQTQVLVVGAGLAGLSAAMFLAQRGIDVLVVDKHPGTSPHPRAAGQSPRTMELLRSAGVAEQVLAASFGTAKGLIIKIAESVRGKVLHTVIGGQDDIDTSTISPAPWGMATQNHVEPIMLARAEKFGAGVRFSTELVSFEQDEHGVTARLMDRWSERISTVRADYLIAADGHRSPIRESLGIARHGTGVLNSSISVLFEADLSDCLDPDATELFFLQNPRFTGAFVRTAEPNQYTFACDYHPERGESIADFTTERLTELIRIALDDPELAVKLLVVQSFEMAAQIADDFRAGRIFLAGDAAKVTPPTGGMGGNTAVADGYDIAWKLAAVLRGEAGPGLLDSYPAERKPYAEQVVNTSLHNAKARVAPNLDLSDAPAPIDQVTLILGYRHNSVAVIAEDADSAVAENPYQPSGRPGYRAPHVPVTRDGADLSTVDLFGTDWVLLTGEEGGGWQEAARHVAAVLGIPLRAYGLGLAGPDQLADPTGGLTAKYGIENGGASLVRPDGVVAWRSAHEVSDPDSTLRGVLTRLLDRANG
ncbi:MAG TPA: FAD-dependent oxidoreductase [Pseudonocardiaceae bacterium]|nr:FAD-dependent oxidoreductase [Pseudonocardiaceae bacterium]